MVFGARRGGSGWAIDLGTTNTGVARWSERSGRPVLLRLGSICRAPELGDPLRAPWMIPSATEMAEEESLAKTVGQVGWLRRHAFLGRWAFIGREALQRNEGSAKPSFVPTFKPYLGRAPLRTLARRMERTVSAREVAHAFVRELLREVRTATGERIRDVVVTSPVEAYESYRAELRAIFRDLGCRRVRFLDEPVAAALGYGVGLERRRRVLVVDFGGGTLDLALVELDPRAAREGRATVVAKAGLPLGGNDVDAWVFEDFCQHFEYDLSLDRDATWRQLALAEARRVKEAVHFGEDAAFGSLPPEELRRFEARLRGEAPGYVLSRDRLLSLLEEGGLFTGLDECVNTVETQAKEQGVSFESLDAVLLVGGSTLLPGVYPRFEERFQRSRVRSWQPFEAVAYGASAFSRGELESSDFIVHDYAFVTHDAVSHEPRYTTIIPARTRFPTRSDHYRAKLVPTCALGEPESIFKLVICEIGCQDGLHRRFGWDEKGALHELGSRGAGDAAYVVQLNESNPTLGLLDPPHEPHDRRPRLDIAFGVDAERWLVATVRDLKTGRTLLERQTVVKLI